MKRYRLRIGGKACDPAGGTWFETQNPYTGEAWAEIPRCDARDVDAAVKAAHAAFTSGPWPEMTATQRGALLRKLGDLIARDAAKLAATEVRTTAS
jgi:aldehyde dehydrogenase (NAD+)